jgi:protein SCO1
MTGFMNWRLASRFSVITLAAVVIVVVVLWGLLANGQASSTIPSAPTPQGGLIGSNLSETLAPNFTLTDQNGQSISLAQFRGKPVVLTFLYSHGVTESIALADKLAVVMHSRGKQAGQVVMLAVSVDPTGDTAASAQQFSQTHNLLNSWHYLLGTRAQLSPVWKDYAISVATLPTTSAAIDAITFTPAVYVIDQQGRERVYFDDSFTPAQLTTDLQKLLGDPTG